MRLLLPPTSHYWKPYSAIEDYEMKERITPSAPIAKALLNAHKRGIKVEVILDKSQRGDKYSSADFLANSGIPTKIDAAHAIAHNKVIIIDGKMDSHSELS